VTPDTDRPLAADLPRGSPQRAGLVFDKPDFSKSRAALYFEGCAQLEFGHKVVRFVMRRSEGKGVQWRADLRTKSRDGSLGRALGLDNVSSMASGVEAALADFLGWARNHGITVDDAGRAACARALA
jgi:hypothetical protein